MRFQFAHVNIQGINAAVFNARPANDTSANRAELLQELTVRARAAGLRVDKSALVFKEGGRNKFYGTPDLVAYLGNAGVPRWTHWLEPR